MRQRIIEERGGLWIEEVRRKLCSSRKLGLHYPYFEHARETQSLLDYLPIEQLETISIDFLSFDFVGI